MRSPDGEQDLVIRYRQHGPQHISKIGDEGRLTPEQARSEAKKLLGRVEAGADPIAERRAERAVRTFTDVGGFLALHVAAKRKGRTGEEYRRLLHLHILPAIGSRRIRDIRRADVARLHSKLAATPYQANRTRDVISAIWNGLRGGMKSRPSITRQGALSGAASKAASKS